MKPTDVKPFVAPTRTLKDLTEVLDRSTIEDRVAFIAENTRKNYLLLEEKVTALAKQVAILMDAYNSVGPEIKDMEEEGFEESDDTDEPH